MSLDSATSYAAITLDKESLQIRLLKSQYEREKRMVEEKVKELALISITGEDQLENET